MAALAPIVLFAYRRPEHTLRLLESLSANPLASRSRLVVFCDGPKTSTEEPAVNEVRRVAAARRWCGAVEIVAQQRHLGLAASVIRGVSAVLAEQERIIVLEDDLVLAPCFLDYMNAALEHYQATERVMQVSGYMFPLATRRLPESCLLPIISSWGWATWRRAWQHFDPEARDFAWLAGQPDVRRRFDLDGAYPFFDLLQRQRAGHVDSWAIRWYLSVFRRGGLTLFPGRSLVRNLGWDGSGTHCHVDDLYDVALAERVPLTFPPHVEADGAATRALIQFFRRRLALPRPSFARRALRRLGRLLTRASFRRGAGGGQ